MMSSCSQFNCVVRGLGASFLYKCPILRGSDLRQHGFLVRYLLTGNLPVIYHIVYLLVISKYIGGDTGAKP